MRLQDIADAAGVSKAKASRALSGRTDIDPSEADRILRIAEEMGYKPNRLVKSLTRKKSGIIGCLVRDMVNPYTGEFLGGIEEEVSGRDCAVVFCDVLARRGSDLRRLLEYRIDGLIMSSYPRDMGWDKDLADYLKSGHPVVSTNAPLPNDPHAVYIFPEYAQGVRTLVGHLTDMGHKRIAFTGNESDDPFYNTRLKGFYDEMTARGLPIDGRLVLCRPGFEDSFDGGIRAANQLMIGTNESDRPTAIVVFNDYMAMGVMAGLRDLGLSVGRDVSVCGFDGTAQGQIVRPRLTTIDIRPREWGREAAGILMDMVEGKERTHSTVIGELIVGDSTGPVPEME